MARHILRLLLMIVPVAIVPSLHTHAALFEKSRGGIHYSYAIMPAASRIISARNVVRLDHFHRAGLNAEIPFNRYLNFGFSFDYTLAMSPALENRRYTMSLDQRRKSVTLLGISVQIRPMLPIPISFGDLNAFLSFEPGFGASSPVTAGAQPLANFEYSDKTTIPSPFPLYLEATAKIGLEYFISEFLGADVGFGYRSLFVVHPMVKAPGVSNINKDDRSAVWYDISSMFVFATLKIVF